MISPHHSYPTNGVPRILSGGESLFTDSYYDIDGVSY